MAKQGNSDNGRKGTRKPSGATSRARKPRPATTPQPMQPVAEPTEGVPTNASARRSPRAKTPRSATGARAAKGSPAGRRRTGQDTTPAAPEARPGTAPEAVAASTPESGEPILPVEVVDAATTSGESLLDDLSAQPSVGRRARDRSGPRSNALGVLIERRFADPTSPVRSYSELERRSHISREALSRYVTPRPDRRRSPTIDTLAAIADAMHLSLEQVCRAAVAGAHGLALPEQTVAQAREEIIGPLMATLSEEQFFAVIELLRQMQGRTAPG